MWDSREWSEEQTRVVDEITRDGMYDAINFLFKGHPYFEKNYHDISNHYNLYIGCISNS